MEKDGRNWVIGRIQVELRVFLNAELPEVTKKTACLTANMPDFTTHVDQMSSKSLVTVRIGAEVVERVEFTNSKGVGA